MKNILRKSYFGFTKWCVAVIVALFALSFVAHAAPVSITASGTYTQDFNTLISTGTGTWANDSTIAAWYAQRTGTGTTIAADTGSSNGGNLYSFGSTSSSDRALGSMGSSNAAAGHFAWGVQFQNTSSSTVTIGTVSYTGEEWRKGGNTTASVVTFWYKVSSSAITSLNPSDLVTDDSTTGWTAVTSLNFSSPVNTATGAALDGNASANKVAVSANSNISVPAGSYVMLRWKHPRPASGSTHGLAIDDISVAYTVVAATAPTAPSITSITPGDGSLSVALTAPSSDGGATISNYQYSMDNGGTFTAFSPARTTSPLSITGLVNNTTYSVQIKAVNNVGAGEASASVDGTPVAPAVPPSLTSSTYTGKVAVAFSQTIPATDSPISFALATGTLPAGLSLDSDTGVISGQPSAAGSFSVTVTASNSSGTSSPATIDFTIDKGGQSITVLAATATKFTTDVPYSLGVAATSGLAVSYASSEIGVATFSGGTVTLVGAGSTTLTASQAGDDNWNPATDVTQTLTVVPPPLATWEVGTQLNGGASPLAPNFSNNNLDVVGLTKGSGVGGVNTGGLWGGNNFTAADQAGAITAATFATFSLTPKLGFKFSISEISSYNIRRSGTGPATCIWQYQKGSGAFTDIGSAITNPTTTASGNTQPAISLSDIADLQNVPAGTTVTFRLSAWGGAAAGTFYINNITGNDLAVQGTVVEDTTVIPALTSFTPAFGAAGATVTISGTNLTEVTGVKFNGQTAIFSYQSGDGTITATVPAGIRAGKIALVYGTPEAEVLSSANFEPLDGSGTATVANADAGSPYLNTAIFARAQSGNQTLAITLNNTITGSSLTSARITLPSDFGTPDEANVTLPGAGSKSVSGNAITVTGVDIQPGSSFTVSISGLSTPDTSASASLDGNYAVTVETAGAGGTLGSILAGPTAYVLIPIANLRDVDSNEEPLDRLKTVAVEGVVTATPLGSTTAKLSAFIQDSTAGLYIYSFSGTLSTQNWATGQVRAVVGTVNHFNGLTQIDPIRDANIVSNGTASLPEPITVTLPLTNPEALEGSLIRIVGLTKSAAELDTWAVPSTITAEDGSANTIDIRMAAGSTALTPPTYPVTVIGVLGQSDNTVPRDSGYQIQPRTQGDLNSVPSNIGLTPTSIAENNAVNAEVGTLSTTDSDVGDSSIYTLVSGTGDADNASFNINGASLRAGVAFDYETKSSYSIRVRTTDSANNTFEKVFTITVTDVVDQTAQEAYLASFGLSGANLLGTADPDGDGLNNDGEFAFGTSPVDGSSRAVTQTSVTGGIKITYLQRSGVTYTVKSATDLATGFTGTVTPSRTSLQPTGLPFGYEQYEATLTGGDRGFIQVEATVP